MVPAIFENHSLFEEYQRNKQTGYVDMYPKMPNITLEQP